MLRVVLLEDCESCQAQAICLVTTREWLMTLSATIYRGDGQQQRQPSAPFCTLFTRVHFAL